MTTFYATLDDRTLEVEVADPLHGGDSATLRVDGRGVRVSLDRLPGTAVHVLTVDGRPFRVVARRKGRGEWRLHMEGGVHDVKVETDRERAIAALGGMVAATAGPDPVRAPMPGLVVKVEVEVGQSVEAGDGLAIVEAMKMENELTARVPGKVRTILVDKGQTVEKGAIMIEFEEDE